MSVFKGTKIGVLALGIVAGSMLTATGAWVFANAVSESVPSDVSDASTLPSDEEPRLSLCPAAAGGDHIPTPFDVFNRKVELADGEGYYLKGTVLVQDTATASGSVPILPSRLAAPVDLAASRAYLSIDLSQHPWLATRYRRVMPLYPLDGSVQDWKPWNGRKVGMTVIAKGKVLPTSEGLKYTITLRLAPGQDIDISD